MLLRAQRRRRHPPARRCARCPPPERAASLVSSEGRLAYRSMGKMESTSPPPGAGGAMLQVVFVDGERSVDLGTVTVQPSLGMQKLQAVVADRVSVAPQQILASLARPRCQRGVPLDEGADLAAAVAREGAGCYVIAGLRRSRRDHRGGRSRRDRKGAGRGRGPSLC